MCPPVSRHANPCNLSGFKRVQPFGRPLVIETVSHRLPLTAQLRRSVLSYGTGVQVNRLFFLPFHRSASLLPMAARHIMRITL